MSTDKDAAQANSDIERARQFIEANIATDKDLGQGVFMYAAHRIATLIADVRNEALEGVCRTMEHRARWASKNHAEPGYIAACRDTLKALDTLKSKKETTE